jgi:putative spermidine/putrescine transport system ATP-binding protein
LPVLRRGDQVLFADTPLLHNSQIPEATSLLLMIRPERVVLSREGPREGVNNFAATATEVVYQGDSFLLHSALASGAQIVLRGAMRGANVTTLPAVGEALTLCLAPEDTVLIDGSEA